jgi:hypothetical protein
MQMLKGPDKIFKQAKIIGLIILERKITKLGEGC